MDKFKIVQTFLYGLKGIVKAPDFREMIQLQHMIEQHTGEHMDPDQMKDAVDTLEHDAYLVRFMETYHKEP